MLKFPALWDFRIGVKLRQKTHIAWISGWLVEMLSPKLSINYMWWSKTRFIQLIQQLHLRRWWTWTCLHLTLKGALVYKHNSDSELNIGNWVPMKKQRYIDFIMPNIWLSITVFHSNHIDNIFTILQTWESPSATIPICFLL